MRLWIELCEAAGFGHRWQQLGQATLAGLFLIGAIVLFLTSVPGLAISLGILAAGAFLELLRAIGARRQRLLDASWPAVFDLMKSGAQAGMSDQEQFSYLAEHGPEALRPSFAQLSIDIEHGISLPQALSGFQSRIGSRSGDLLALVLLVASEIGGRGQVDVWQRTASEIRAEIGLIGEVIARQSWVLLSAKIALLAPWLVAFLLLGPSGNREAFASQTGTLVLLLGLLLSVAAYFLTNLLGRLKLPGRLFHVA